MFVWQNILFDVDRIMQDSGIIVDSRGKVEVFDENTRFINCMMDKIDLEVDMKYKLDKIMSHI